MKISPFCLLLVPSAPMTYASANPKLLFVANVIWLSLPMYSENGEVPRKECLEMCWRWKWNSSVEMWMGLVSAIYFSGLSAVELMHWTILLGHKLIIYNGSLVVQEFEHLEKRLHKLFSELVFYLAVKFNTDHWSSTLHTPTFISHSLKSTVYLMQLGGGTSTCSLQDVFFSGFMASKILFS